MSAEPAGPRLRHQLPLLAWLVLVWILLWGTWSWANMLVGRRRWRWSSLLLLPLPPVVGGTRVRPLPLVALRRRTSSSTWSVSGAQVAWRALGPGGVAAGRDRAGAAARRLRPAAHRGRRDDLAGARLAGARPRPGGAADRRAPAARRTTSTTSSGRSADVLATEGRDRPRVRDGRRTSPAARDRPDGRADEP